MVPEMICEELTGAGGGGLREALGEDEGREQQPLFLHAAHGSGS